MKRTLAILYPFVAALAALDASAHRLVPDDGSHSSAETALFLEDPGLSQVVYHEVTTDANPLWITFEAEAGLELYWQLGLPAITGLEDYRPEVLLFGPGLPPVTAPVEPPEGLGGIRVDTGDLPAEQFDERFTGTRDWILYEEDRVLEAAGRYYLVAYHPQGTPGKFWIAVGRREEFNLADLRGYGEVLRFVREYHEVADQPLPLLPRMLLTLSRIFTFLYNIVSIF